ncbi:MAG: RNA polymerase II elongation factor [Pycnora praestabilis]|nr:MAG: RNA polymerase II elongation factor [Pycnora praestabilis]
MDAKEIESRARALQKATADGQPAANITSILEDLKKRVVPTEDLLRSTKIGVIVNRSRQHKDPGVARLAGDIVSKWRIDVNKAKAAAGQGGASGKKPSITSPPLTTTANGKTASPTPAGGAEKAKFTVPPDQRDWKKDGVDTKKIGNATRDNCLGLMYNGLCYGSEAAPSEILRRASHVEAAAFSTLGPETQEAYRSKMRSLYQNLKNKSNLQLRARILSGEISPERFVVMSPEELKSAERRAEDEKLQQLNMNDSMMAKAEKSISNMLQCGKCGMKRVSYTQAQTRSADEPMTTFCTCENCGKQWKFS